MNFFKILLITIFALMVSPLTFANSDKCKTPQGEVSLQRTAEFMVIYQTSTFFFEKPNQELLSPATCSSVGKFIGQWEIVQRMFSNSRVPLGGTVSYSQYLLISEVAEDARFLEPYCGINISGSQQKIDAQYFHDLENYQDKYKELVSSIKVDNWGCTL